MNVKELKTIKNRIKEIQEQAADITDQTDELQNLITLWDDAIGKLSYDSLEGNEIYLHYVAGYSWKRIANLYDTGVQPAAVMKRCQRYEW